MSRIGRKSVSVPSGVTANIEGQTVKVKGPKGALQVVLPDDVAPGDVDLPEDDRLRILRDARKDLIAVAERLIG